MLRRRCRSHVDASVQAFPGVQLADWRCTAARKVLQQRGQAASSVRNQALANGDHFSSGTAADRRMIDVIVTD